MEYQAPADSTVVKALAFAAARTRRAVTRWARSRATPSAGRRGEAHAEAAA